MKQFQITPAKFETCSHCGVTRQVSPALYRIPSEEETKAAQTYYDQETDTTRPLSEYPE